MHDASWTFYGREGCDCCTAAAGFLLHMLHGQRLSLRMVDLVGHPPGSPHSIPAFTDPRGKVVWEGSFDSEATRMALEAWGVARIHQEPAASPA